MPSLFTDDGAFLAFLKDIQKPGQYLGSEVNAVKKGFAVQRLRVALVFPDAYEMGMSHMGLKILYEILNAIPGVVAERCFAPGLDLEKKLRDLKIPLFSLESRTPLGEFDLVGITLPYELTYTNALNIIDLAGIPVWQKERGENHPIILAGGTQAFNPEPMADFLDAVAIGDGEELIVEIADKIVAWKEGRGIDRISKNRAPGARAELLNALAGTSGVYVPSFFVPEYNDDNTLSRMRPLKPGYDHVNKRIVRDLNAQPYPTKLVVPNVKLIHDRIGIEIQRGCTRMCRFCQAGYIDRPTRQRSPERVLEIAEESLKNTGIDEISLLSLSAGDYATIVPTLKQLNHRYAARNVSISVPATRTETLTPEMIEQLKKVRRSGFTIAPEAGSERMRRVINKGNKVEDLLKACHNAFSAGYRLIKFYYMVGLPFEGDDDVIGIAREAGLALDVGHEHGRNVQINVSVSSFVPKPFTPFQWAPQMTMAETERRHALVRKNLKSKRLVFKHHDARMSYLEGLFARGDRRLSRLLHHAFVLGCRFDEWSEHFDFDKWQAAITQTGTDATFYLHRERTQDEVLPWDHLFSQMKKDWLWGEFQAAHDQAFIEDCSTGKCARFCGVCDFRVLKNRIYVIDEKPLAVRKGNREAYGRFGGETSSRVHEVSRGTSLSGVERDPSTASLGDSTQDDIDPRTHAPMHPSTRPRHYRLRIYYAKTGPAVLSGHIELMTFFKRAFLRASVPVAYSAGFHPQIKLSMGPALPVGLESACEALDVTLLKEMDTDEFVKKMRGALPEGLLVAHAKYVDLNAPSIYSEIAGVDYQVTFNDSFPAQALDDLTHNLSALAGGREIFYTRGASDRQKGLKTFPLSRHLRMPVRPPIERKFEFSTLMGPEGTLKPTEVVQALAGVHQTELANLRVKKVGVFSSTDR